MKHKKHRTTLTAMVIKAVCGIGFGILALTLISFQLLSIISKSQSLTVEVFVDLNLMIAVGYILLVIGLIVFLAFLSARKLKKRGLTILKVTEKIKAQDLDFDISPSGVKEIDQILESMDDMRLALKEALEKQWRLEQNRKDQISALAHDFKTPITVLKGNLDLLNSSQLDHTYKEYVKDARGSLEQIETYLSHLLEVTRAERGYIVSKQRIELGAFVNETVSMLKQLADDKEITILTEKSREDLFLMADRILLERVFQNLISNALDYTPQRGVIKISLTSDNDNAIIMITDSGCGFSPSALKHGTEQFFMEDASRNRRNHYGLGLFIAASMIRQHDGSIQLANDELTGGARVRIHIPLIKE